MGIYLEAYEDVNKDIKKEVFNSINGKK